MNLPAWYPGAAEGQTAKVTDENEKEELLYVRSVEREGQDIYWSKTQYGNVVGCSSKMSGRDPTYGASGYQAKVMKRMFGGSALTAESQDIVARIFAQPCVYPWSPPEGPLVCPHLTVIRPDGTISRCEHKKT